MNKNSIKVHVWARVIAALLASLLMGAVVNLSIGSIRTAEENTAEANALLSQAQSAKAAHYNWYIQLGDALYAPAPVAARAPRQMLHAWHISFCHPLSGEALEKLRAGMMVEVDAEK